MIEIKSNDDSLSTNFKIFEKFLPEAEKIQLVDGMKKEKTYPDKTEIRELASWLSNLDFSP